MLLRDLLNGLNLQGRRISIRTRLKRGGVAYLDSCFSTDISGVVSRFGNCFVSESDIVENVLIVYVIE